MAEQESPAPYKDSDKFRIKQAVVRELRSFVEHIPEPDDTWQVIWVLSGPEHSVDDAGEDARGNQTKERLERGFALQRAVAAIKTGKRPDELSLMDIAMNGPVVVFNGLDEHNDILLHSIRTGQFEKQFNAPSSGFHVVEQTDIKHTGHQFDRFPSDSLLPTSGKKMVIVSDLYHLPRVKRYISQQLLHWNLLPEQIVLYPAEPKLRIGRMFRELENIPDYVARGILPAE